MTTKNTTNVSDIAPLGHRDAMQLQQDELTRAIRLLRDFEPTEWTAQTDCPDWDVRQMWLHVLGACEASASMREGVHQMRRARQLRRTSNLPLEAGLSSTQVAERDHLEPDELVSRLERVAPKAVRGRTRMPAVIRAIKISIDAPVVEKWSLGYLNGTIYLRDLWMHRVDTSRATRRHFEATPEHDGHIVADIVGEWSRRHGRPFDLELTGPAGGNFAAGSGGESLTMDAVEFCRQLAGRAQPTGLLTTIVPF